MFLCADRVAGCLGWRPLCSHIFTHTHAHIFNWGDIISNRTRLTPRELTWPLPEANQVGRPLLLASLGLSKLFPTGMAAAHLKSQTASLGT